MNEERNYVSDTMASVARAMDDFAAALSAPVPDSYDVCVGCKTGNHCNGCSCCTSRP